MKAQVNDASSNLTNQATKMGDAFIKSDYKTLAHYTYPVIVNSMGGASKMATTLTKITNDMQAQGMTFTNVTFEEPTNIIKSGKELQSTIAQHLEIKLTTGRLVTISTLIAISIDNGNN